MTINAFEAGDARRETVRVAGIAALFVAKTHKIGDRLESERSDRLEDKDAADLLRLMQSSDPKATGRTLALLAADEISGEATAVAIERFQELFGNRAGVGIAMAVRALRVAMPEERVRAICLSYAEDLRGVL